MSAKIVTRLIAGLALLVTVSVGGSAFFPAVSAQTSDDTLLVSSVIEGEMHFPLLNRCAVARPAINDPEQAARARQAWGAATWSGPCRHGLAHGHGILTIPRSDGSRFSREAEYVYGERVSVTREWEGGFVSFDWLHNGETVLITFQRNSETTGDDVRDAIAALSAATLQFAAPVPTPTIETLSNLIHSDGAQVTVRVGGDWLRNGREPCTRQLARSGGVRCRDGDIVHGVSRSQSGAPPSFVPCPNFRTWAGCEAMWNEQGASILANARRIIAAAEASYPQRRAERVQQFEAALPLALATERARAAAEAEAVIAAEREREREERAFQTSLGTMNAGQLFNRADELARNGEAARAEAARRALIERFPNSPLAATAAQQLAGTSNTSGAGGQFAGSSENNSAAAQSAASGQVSRRSRSCQDYLYDYMPAIADGSVSHDDEYSVFIHSEYERLAQAIDVCRNNPTEMAGLRSSVDSVRRSCRSAGLSRCERGHDPRPQRQRDGVRPAFNDIVERARADAAGGQSQADPARTNQCPRTPDQEVAAFDAEMGQVRARNPTPDVAAGTRAQYLWMASFAVESLRRIEPYRVCMAHRYAPLRRDLENVRDTAINGCEAVSTLSGEAARRACVQPMR